MKKNGFTLIELLAVIVILAIIALIATPIILNIIEDMRKEAFKATGYGIVDAAENGLSSVMVKGETIVDTVYTYIDGTETRESGNINLKYDGLKPENGTVMINTNGEIAIAIHNGAWCATKGYDDDKIILEEKNKQNCSVPADLSGEITKTYTVSNALDDGWTEFAGSEGFYPSNTYIWVGYMASYRNLWVKWNNIDIPKDSTIVSAKIQYRNITAGMDHLEEPCQTVMYFNNVGNAVSPTNYTEFEGKSLTSNNVVWDISKPSSDVWYDSPDISSIIQEIVDRGDWNSGNSMMLLHRRHSSNNSGFQGRIFYSYESGASNAPKLVVTYSVD